MMLHREPLEINWEEFKEFKKDIKTDKDNFRLLLDFIRSYYNMSNTFDIYNMLKHDDTANMMLEKREIIEAMGLEKYLYKIF